MLSWDGKIVVGYLGTEPSLYKVPVDKFIVNYADRIEDFKKMEQKIREQEATGATSQKAGGLQMRLSIGEFGKRTIEPNAANNAPYCMVNVELSGLQNITKLHLNIASECASPTKQMVFNVSPSKSTLSTEIPFYVGSKTPPTSNKVTIAVHDYFTHLTAISTIELPLKVLFEESQVDRNAKYKVTIDTSVGVLALNKLFEASDETHASIDEIFTHSFQTSAWNMCVIPGKDEELPSSILVQSIDCKLSLYDGEQCTFALFPLRALHPGPIGYCLTTQILFAANNGFLAAIKFSLLSQGQKKMNYDWSFNLGDTAMQMEITEGSKPTTIVLCRRHVSAFNASGTVVWQIRLEAVGMSMCLYRSLLINNTQFNRLIIATADDTLLIFQDNKLVWNCNSQMSPVALLVCSYNSIPSQFYSVAVLFRAVLFRSSSIPCSSIP
uniref:PTHB1 N-terminal domain-containing protein n=1 Tax=Caenorhabditis japonica TaxID=281687 RepID=A0A8R1HKR0_CAEJA